MALSDEEKRKRAVERTRLWQLAHPERVKEQRRLYWERHPDARAKANAKMREYSRTHRERVRGLRRKLYAEHPEVWQKRLAWQREWRKKNIEKVKAEARVLWASMYANDPERFRNASRKQRAARRGAKGRFDHEHWMQKVAYYGWRCYYCGKKLTTSSLTQDHAIPLSRGGSQWVSNLLPACLSCNSKKKDKTVFEYISKAAAWASSIRPTLSKMLPTP